MSDRAFRFCWIFITKIKVADGRDTAITGTFLPAEFVWLAVIRAFVFRPIIGGGSCGRGRTFSFPPLQLEFDDCQLHRSTSV